jgi:uncharacterized protein
MQIRSVVQSDLPSPPVLVRGDLTLPERLYSGLATYLLLATGLRGGHELAATQLWTVFLPAVATPVRGILIPVAWYAVLKLLHTFGLAESVALAAHDGSVSAATVAAPRTFLDGRAVPYEGFVASRVPYSRFPPAWLRW